MSVAADMLSEFHAVLNDERGRGNAALRLTLHEEEHEELLDELAPRRLDVREPKADEDVDRARLARELRDGVGSLTVCASHSAERPGERWPRPL